MSTQTEMPPAEPAPPAPQHHDEFSGAFGFFRRYQKLILYTAGIFALVTFSITGAMTQFFRNVTTTDVGPRPTMRIGGADVEISADDERGAQRLALHFQSLPFNVQAPLSGRAGSSEMVKPFSMLLCLSRTLGLDVSMAEVDRAIRWQLDKFNDMTKGNDTPTQMALQRGLSSLGEYRDLVRDAMRVGDLVYLHSLGVDGSEAALMERLLHDEDTQSGVARDKITMRVATFDMKALEATLKAAGDVTEEQIQEWMNKKSDIERRGLQVYDSNHVALALGIARFDAFDEKEWEDKLKDFQWGEAQQKSIYESEKEPRFKIEGQDKKYQPMDDPEVQKKIKAIAQVHEVLMKLRKDLADEQATALKAKQEALATARGEQGTAQAAVANAKTDLAAKPDDEALKQKVTDAERVLGEKEAAVKAASDAIDAERKAFDFKGRFAALTEGKKGFEVKEIAEKKNADDLKDLSALDLGNWKFPQVATQLRTPGDLGSQPARAEKGEFLFQATDVLLEPMKPWEKIKESVTTSYFQEKARNTGDEKKKALEDALLRLGKEKAPDKVAEILGKKQGEIDKRFSAWEQSSNAELEKATRMLSTSRPGTMAWSDWSARHDAVEKELADKEGRRTTITAAVDKELEDEVAKVAKEHYAEVMDVAAADAGFSLDTVGPLRRDLQSLYRDRWFDKRFDRTVVFLWGMHVAKMKAGDITDIVNDFAERRWQIAKCEAVQPLEPSDILRREFDGGMRTFLIGQMSSAIHQAFTEEALQKRYSYKLPEQKAAK